MPSNHHYNKRLQGNANKLRKRMTKAEACLWKYVLGKRQLGGHQFRRQRPIDNYIVDFVCLPLKLIIEVDGITHSNEDAPIKDRERQERLEELGFSVLRFEDEEVLNHINRVREEILEKIVEVEKKECKASTPCTLPVRQAGPAPCFAVASRR